MGYGQNHLFGGCHHQMSNGLNLLHSRKDSAEMAIVFSVSFIVPEGHYGWFDLHHDGGNAGLVLHGK